MTFRVGINGFGRIGRLITRAWKEAPMYQSSFEIAMINDVASPELSAHLLKHDSTYGPFTWSVGVEGENIRIGNTLARYTQQADRAAIPWSSESIQLVIEASGRCKERVQAAEHQKLNGQSVRRLLVTQPMDDPDHTFVYGINHASYDPAAHRVISGASCTTNALVPLAYVLEQQFGVRWGLMSTIHAATNDQRVLDTVHEDLYRARGALQNIIPTKTGAAKTAADVLNALPRKGRRLDMWKGPWQLTGHALRVPTETVSLVQLVAQLERVATASEVNAAFTRASEEDLRPILEVTRDKCVSSDFRGNRASCIAALDLTTVLPGTGAVMVFGWYDNEWAYACRICELVAHIADADAHQT